MFSKNDLFRLIFPLVIEQILAATIGIADTVMVSGVGEAAVSGVSLVDSINLLLINVFAALATGGAIIVAFACNNGTFYCTYGVVLNRAAWDFKSFVWQRRGRCYGTGFSLFCHICSFLPFHFSL